MMVGGATSSTVSSGRHRRWSILLPVSILAVTVCLLVIGHYQQHSVPSEWRTPQTGAEWTPGQSGPLPQGIQCAYAINFPALLIVSSLEFSNISSKFTKTLFLFAVGGVWYVIGWLLEMGFSWSPRRKSIVIAAASIGLVMAAAGIGIGIGNLGLHYFAPPVGALVWSAGLIFMSITALRNAILVRS